MLLSVLKSGNAFYFASRHNLRRIKREGATLIQINR
jgi:hypothetical protein